MIRRVRMWVVFVGVCLASTMAANADPVGDAHKAIRWGQGDKLLAALKGPRAPASLERPDVILELCRLTCDNVFWLCVNDQSETVDAATLLLEFADTCVAGHETDPDAHLGMAFAHLMRARARHINPVEEAVEDYAARGGAEDPDAEGDLGNDYAAAALAFHAAHKLHRSDSESLRWAALATIESLRDPETEDPAAARATAEADVERIEKYFPLSPAAVHVRAALDLARVEVELEQAKMSKEIAAIRKRLTNLLETLQPIAQVDIDAGTTYNDTITLIRKNKKKLPLKFEYATEFVSKQGIWMSIPRSRRWRFGTRIFQFDRDGVVLRKFVFDDYSWTSEYTWGSKAIGGDNAKGLCSYDVDSVTGMFSKINRKRSAVKGRLNRNISGCYYYWLQGKDTDGDDLTVRSYFFKSTLQRLTHNLTIYEWINKKEIDPAGKFVIGSMTEKPRKRKKR